MKTRTLTHDDIPARYAELVGLFMPLPPDRPAVDTPPEEGYNRGRQMTDGFTE